MSRTYEITRADLVRYAGASGDFNPIHFNDAVAEQVGLPGVLAHGMLTMGIAIQPLVDEVGQDRIVDYQVRFTKPVVVDALERATLTVEVSEPTPLEDGLERYDLTVTAGETRVLTKAQVVVRGA